MQKQSSLKAKAVSGLFWSSLDLIGNQGIRFIIQIVLARLLLPKDFGIIGMITIFIAVSQSIIDSGFQNALIREKNSSQEDYSTVFYFNLIMAGLLYILLFVTAPAISRFYNEPQLVLILRVLSIVIIINSFGLIQRTILIKNINFKVQTKISIISSVASGVIAILFAFKGFGVWSLVIQNLTMQFIQSLMLSLSNRWLPSLVFSIKSFKRLFGFGWKLLVSGLINTLYQNIYYVIIGRFFSAPILGYYTNAQKLRDVASQSITSSVQKVSYPVLSSIQDDFNRLKKGYQKIIQNSVFITFPIMIGLSAVAESFIIVVFGEKWINSIPYFQVLCFAGMLYPLHAINLNILQVKGRSDLFLRLEIYKKIIGITSIVIVLFFKLGVMGLVWASAINSVIAYFINSYYSADLISYSVKDQLKDIMPSLLISLFMGAVVYTLNYLNAAAWQILILQVVVGIILYIGLAMMFKIESFAYLIATIKDVFKGRKGVSV